MWRQLHHINVLPLLCLFRGNDDHPRIGLVSPWMENGNIQRYVYRKPNADRVSLVRNYGLEILAVTYQFIRYEMSPKASNISIP